MAEKNGINFSNLCKILIEKLHMRKVLNLSLFFFSYFFLYTKILIVIIYKKIEKKIHKIVIHNLNNIDESLVRRKINLNEGQSFWDLIPQN